MSKRLQVILSEDEFAHFQEAAGKRSSTPADEKIAVIRRAETHSFPAPDIEEMLAEIESGDARDT